MKILISESQLSMIINEQITSVPLLRKLSYKSKLNFGKYAELSVEEVFRLLKLPYLRWIYYNLNGISFIDPILDELGITDEFRITKPGINPELGEKLGVMKHNKMSLKRRAHTDKVTKIRKIGKYIDNKRNDNFFFSKGNMQKRNQGG